MKYKNKASRMIGTGWLINRDLVVTAGHCAFDWPSTAELAQDPKTNPRELVEAEVYVGYQGKATLEDDLKSGLTQKRNVVSVATTFGFITVQGRRQLDVSFMKLDRPFDDVKPFDWDNTPLKGSVTLGIVGYPGDEISNGENGAKMWEMFKDVTFDLHTSKYGMLEYSIDTFGGKSPPGDIKSC